MHVLGHSLLMRLLTLPHCLIQRDGWLYSGEESGLHSVTVLGTLSVQSCCAKFVVVRVGLFLPPEKCSCHDE